MWFIGVEVEQDTSAPPPKKTWIRPCRRRFYPFAGLKNFTTISCFHLSIQMYFDARTQVSITTFFMLAVQTAAHDCYESLQQLYFPQGSMPGHEDRSVARPHPLLCQIC